MNHGELCLCTLCKILKLNESWGQKHMHMTAAAVYCTLKKVHFVSVRFKHPDKTHTVFDPVSLSEDNESLTGQIRRHLDNPLRLFCTSGWVWTANKSGKKLVWRNVKNLTPQILWTNERAEWEQKDDRSHRLDIYTSLHSHSVALFHCNDRASRSTAGRDWLPADFKIKAGRVAFV